MCDASNERQVLAAALPWTSPTVRLQDFARPASAELRFRRFGCAEYARLRKPSAPARPAPTHVEPGDADRVLVVLLRQGRAVVRQDDRTAELRVGEFALLDGSRPGEVEFHGGGHDLQFVRLHRDLLEGRLRLLEDLTATAIPANGAPARLLAAMLDAVCAMDGAPMPSAVTLSLSEAVLHVLVAGLQALQQPAGEKTTALAAYHRARVKAHVREQLRDPELSVASIAAAVQLSPDHLCKLFREEPVPLSRWIWQLRLDACRRDLADPQLAARSVSEVAFSWGFNDASHFSRSFRERFGMSPREWRALQQAPAGVAA